MDFPIDEVIFEASALQSDHVKKSIGEVAIMKDRDILGKHPKGGPHSCIVSQRRTKHACPSDGMLGVQRHTLVVWLLVYIYARIRGSEQREREMQGRERKGQLLTRECETRGTALLP